MSWQGEHLRPGGEFAGGDNHAPDLVLGEVVQGQVWWLFDL